MEEYKLWQSTIDTKYEYMQIYFSFPILCSAHGKTTLLGCSKENLTKFLCPIMNSTLGKTPLHGCLKEKITKFFLSLSCAPIMVRRHCVAA